MSSVQPLVAKPQFASAQAANTEHFLDPMAQQLATLESRAEWASQQFGALVGDIQAMRGGLMSAQEHAKRVYAANQALSIKLRQMAAEFAAVAGQRDEARAEQNELLQIARSIAEAHSGLEAELSAERAKSAQLGGVVAELERALDQAELNAQRAVTQSASQEEAHMAQMQRVVAEMEFALDRAEEEAQSLRIEVSEQGAELDRVAEAMVQACDDQARLEEAKNELERALDDEGDDRATLLGALRERDSELEALRKEVVRERDIATQRAHDKQEAEEVNEKLRSEITRLRTILIAK